MLLFQNPPTISQSSRYTDTTNPLTPHGSQRGPFGEKCPSPEPYSTPKSPVNEPPSRLPSGAFTERHASPLSPPPRTLPDPQQRSPPYRFPLTELPQGKMLHSRSPNSNIKIPNKRTPQPGSPTGPLRRHPFPEPSSTNPLITHLSLKVCGKGYPLHVPQQRPYGERCSVSRPLVYSFIYMSQSTVKQLSYEMRVNIRSPSTDPHADGRPT